MCARYFCRECVTEHGGRLLCVVCLRVAAPKDAARPAARFVRKWLAMPAVMGFAFAGAWLLLYEFGQALIAFTVSSGVDK